MKRKGKWKGSKKPEREQGELRDSGKRKRGGKERESGIWGTINGRRNSKVAPGN